MTHVARILNALFLLLVAGASIMPLARSASPAHALGTVAACLLICVPLVYAFLALGDSAHARKAGIWNMFATAGSWSLAAGLAIGDNVPAAGAWVAFGLLFFGNVVILRAGRKAELKRAAMAADPASTPDWASEAKNGDEEGGEEAGGAAVYRSFIAPEPSSNYFVAHWRGEYTLPVSYFINGGLIPGLFAVAATSGSDYLLGAGISLKTNAWISMFLWVGGILVWMWAAVGVWRSANRHVSRGGSAAWKNVAQVLVIIGGLVCIANVVKSLPLVRDFALIGVGRDPLGKISVKISSNAQSIVVSGAFGEGAAEAVEKVLNTAPRIKTLVLQSGGGRMLEAKRVARLIQSRGLNTYVESYCMSACTIVFVAGKDRAATPNAKIGFHQPSFSGSGKEDIKSLTADMESEYRGAKLPEGFIRKIVTTDSKSMWYPTRDELIAANVITRISFGGEVTSLDSMMRSKPETLLMLRSTPIWVAIEARFPGTTETVVDKMWVLKQAGANDGKVMDVARSVVGGLYPRILATADDAMVDRFGGLIVRQMEAARAVNVDACVKLISSQLNIAATLPPGYAEEEQQYLLEALRAQPVVVNQVSKARTQQAIQSALATLSPEEIRAVVKSSDFLDRPGLVCEANYKFYRVVMVMPAAERNIILRGIFKGD
jgi:hypothetical protein